MAKIKSVRKALNWWQSEPLSKVEAWKCRWHIRENDDDYHFSSDKELLKHVNEVKKGLEE